MNRDVAQKLWIAFDPMRPLTDQDQSLYVRRTDDVAAGFARQFLFPKQHKVLVLGAVGSGKSTEIYRLAQQHRLSEPNPVVGVLDLTTHFEVAKLEPIQVLVVLALAMLRLVPDAGRQPSSEVANLANAYAELQGRPSSAASEIEPHLQKLARGLLVLVGRGAEVFAGAELLPESVLQAGADALVQAAPLRRLSVPKVPPGLDVNERRVTQVTEAVNSLVRWTRRSLDNRPLTLFVDGLDKIPEPDDAHRMFGCGILDQFQASLVLAAPLVLRIDPTMTHAFRRLYLGNFRVLASQAQDGLFPDEIGQMRSIFRLRVVEQGIDPESAIVGGCGSDGLLDRLILASGGLSRDFIHLCRLAVEHGSTTGSANPLSDAEVSAAIEELRKRYLYALDAERLGILQATRNSEVRQSGAEADRLLNSNHVLCYGNGDPLYRPHPLILDYLQRTSNAVPNGA